MKTHKITFRAEDNLKNFLDGFARANGMERSELIRQVLVYFHMGFLMGEFRRPTKKDLEKKFLKKFKNKKEREQFIKQYDKLLLKDLIG